jgi:hypothetical protein
MTECVVCLGWDETVPGLCWFVASPSLEVWVQSQATSCGICGRQSGLGAGFSPSTVSLHLGQSNNKD